MTRIIQYKTHQKLWSLCIKLLNIVHDAYADLTFFYRQLQHSSSINLKNNTCFKSKFEKKKRCRKINLKMNVLEFACVMYILWKFVLIILVQSQRIIFVFWSLYSRLVFNKLSFIFLLFYILLPILLYLFISFLHQNRQIHIILLLRINFFLNVILL